MGDLVRERVLAALRTDSARSSRNVADALGGDIRLGDVLRELFALVNEGKVRRHQIAGHSYWRVYVPPYAPEPTPTCCALLDTACPYSRGRYRCWEHCHCRIVNHDPGDEQV